MHDNEQFVFPLETVSYYNTGQERIGRELQKEMPLFVSGNKNLFRCSLWRMHSPHQQCDITSLHSTMAHKLASLSLLEQS